jgi:hypothetical protein
MTQRGLQQAAVERIERKLCSIAAAGQERPSRKVADCRSRLGAVGQISWADVGGRCYLTLAGRAAE